VPRAEALFLLAHGSHVLALLRSLSGLVVVLGVVAFAVYGPIGETANGSTNSVPLAALTDQAARESRLRRLAEFENPTPVIIFYLVDSESRAHDVWMSEATMFEAYSALKGVIPDRHYYMYYARDREEEATAYAKMIDVIRTTADDSIIAIRDMRTPPGN
jgi:hypothetical protein